VTLVPVIGFVLIALLAVGFATLALWWPERRPGKVGSEADRFSVRPRDQNKPKGWMLLAGAIALFLLGVGGGTYWIVGRPGLASRAAQGIATRDINGLIPFLIARVRKAPDDLQAWVYLGRAYMTVGDAVEASKAYGRAVTVARLSHNESGELDSAYGEAEVAANGAVTAEAEDAFKAALALNPKDAAARFFLAQARVEHGDRDGAMALLQSLLADTPVNVPLHQTLVDRIALLTAQASGARGGGAPDPKVMVAGLAARLKADPNDAGGWQRLIRAYAVLGQPADAKTALATARKTFVNDKNVMAALESEAAELKLN
jgi:cytochrome c-type biogenesis protein CcmH